MSRDRDTRETSNRPQEQDELAGPADVRSASLEGTLRGPSETSIRPLELRGNSRVLQTSLVSTQEDHDEPSFSPRPVQGVRVMPWLPLIGRSRLQSEQSKASRVPPTVLASFDSWHVLRSTQAHRSTATGVRQMTWSRTSPCRNRRPSGAAMKAPCCSVLRCLPAQRLPEGPGQLERSGSCLTGLIHFLVRPLRGPLRLTSTKKWAGGVPAHRESVFTKAHD